jgi:hypothetical protein
MHEDATRLLSGPLYIRVTRPAGRWLDGYQHFAGAPYSPSLCVVIDVRFVVPAAGSSAPAGWALLPVFERAGPYVASGAYQLPLFQVRGAHRAQRGREGKMDSVLGGGCAQACLCVQSSAHALPKPTSVRLPQNQRARPSGSP